MKDFNKLAKQAGYQAFTSAWLSKKSPVIYIYGHTGAGKTYSLGTLLSHVVDDGTRPYAPVLYLDGDGGSETVGELAENEELCSLVEYDGPYDGKLLWWFEKLEAARRAKCGAIIIEGASALFDSMLTPHIQATSKAAGQEAWQAHNEPSQRINTFWQSIKQLSDNRKYDGNGVPIFVTLNCRELGEQGEKYFVPDFSPNVTRKAMRTADMFGEMRRDSSTKILCLPDPQNKFRKLRRDSVAHAVQAAWDLTLPGLLALWAFENAKARKRLNKSMAALVADAAEATPIPEPQTEESPT